MTNNTPKPKRHEVTRVWCRHCRRLVFRGNATKQWEDNDGAEGWICARCEDPEHAAEVEAGQA